MLGFLTREFTVDRGRGPEALLAVYVPTNHLYLGDIVICEREHAIVPRHYRRRGHPDLPDRRHGAAAPAEAIIRPFVRGEMTVSVQTMLRACASSC